MYLPKQATIEQSCDWLQAKTGEAWVLARLLESGAVPSFWLDYSPGWPAIVFGGRKEGYLASMPFAGDTERLAIEGNDALVTMFYSHDGELVAPTPGLRVALADLRFSREDVARIAEIINAAQNAQAAQVALATKPMPVHQTAQAAPPAPPCILKKSAMVSKYRAEWPTIEADIREASRNGLKQAAATDTHGMWDADKATAWAKSMGKLSSLEPRQQMATPWPGAVTRHDNSG